MSEITKTEDRKPKPANRYIRLFFALLIIAVYFTGLDIPLLGPDEPRYSQVAREMFERNDWVTPTLGGFDWFEKPALLYWLQIASYHAFGVSEFAARFGSALFGLGTVLSLWILGRQWSVAGGRWPDEKPKTEDRRPKTDYADWLALIAASSIGLIIFSRGASFDIILTFPITASLVGFFVWEISHREHREHGENKKANNNKADNNKKEFSVLSVPSVALICFYFFIGVALIAKGLVGIVFPFAIVAFYHLLSWKFPSKTFIFSLFWGTALSLAVASVWYLPMYRANGWKFVDEFFVQHHFQRYTSNKYQHPQPFYFFFWVLPLMTIPWLPFFLASIWKLIRSFKSVLGTQDSAFSIQRFALAWLAVPLVFFSLSGSKLPGYILPAVPAALILTADYLYGFLEKSRARKIAVQTIAVITLVLIAVLSQFETDFLREETVRHLVKTAESEGYKTEKIFSLHTISHSMEFYGAGRLAREADGKQKRFYGLAEIVEQMRRDRQTQALVLIPLKHQNLLTESELVEARALDNNGELALVLIKDK